MEKENLYVKALPYAYFMDRVFGMKAREKKGYGVQDMEHLMSTELEKPPSYLPTHAKQLAMLKKCLFKGLCKYKTLPLNDDEKNIIIACLAIVESLNTSAEIMEIVESVLKLTERHFKRTS